MGLRAYVCYLISSVIALLIMFGYYSLGHLLISRVPFNPCDLDCSGCFFNQTVVEVLPKVSVSYKGVGLVVEIVAVVIDSRYHSIRTICEHFTVGANMHRTSG